MKRYQIYLRPNTVKTLETVAGELEFNRSELIRDVLDRVAGELSKVVTAARQTKVENHPLMKLAGIGESHTGKVSENIDDIYLYD